MARRTSRLGSNFFLFVLAALLVFCLWQNMALKKEIETLKARPTAARMSKAETTQGHSLLEKAWDHINKALKFAKDGDTVHARKELDRSVQLTQKAGANIVDPLKGRLDGAQGVAREWLDKLDAAKKAFNAKPTKTEED